MASQNTMQQPEAQTTRGDVSPQASSKGSDDIEMQSFPDIELQDDKRNANTTSSWFGSLGFNLIFNANEPSRSFVRSIRIVRHAFVGEAAAETHRTEMTSAIRPRTWTRMAWHWLNCTVITVWGAFAVLLGLTVLLAAVAVVVPLWIVAGLIKFLMFFICFLAECVLQALTTSFAVFAGVLMPLDLLISTPKDYKKVLAQYRRMKRGRTKGRKT